MNEKYLPFTDQEIVMFKSDQVYPEAFDLLEPRKLTFDALHQLRTGEYRWIVEDIREC